MATGVKVIARNKKASHEFELSDRFEAGLELQGTEVKSLRLGKVNLTDGWIDFENNEAFLRDVHISQYKYGNIYNHEEKRTRKLLLKRKEIIRLQSKAAEKGFAIVPTKIYFKGQYAKIEIALGKGKKLYDKRESSKKRDHNLEMQRALKR